MESRPIRPHSLLSNRNNGPTNYSALCPLWMTFLSTESCEMPCELWKLPLHFPPKAAQNGSANAQTGSSPHHSRRESCLGLPKVPAS